MSKSNLPIAAVVALSAGMLFAATEIASAQKAQKMTYEQAYEKCRTTDMVGTGSAAGPGASQAYSRGAACMKKYGFRLKK
jgi:hypothetical protein